MDEKKPDSEAGLRDKILAGPTYSDVALPDAGSVRMLPYISSLALDAYANRVADHRDAFDAMLHASMEGGLPPSLALSERDADAIARLYAEHEGFLDAYASARSLSSTVEAFAASFTASKTWLEHQESLERLKDHFAETARTVDRLSPMLDSHARQIARLTSGLPRLDPFLTQLVAPPAWLETKALLAQMESSAALAKAFETDRVATAIHANFEKWAGLADEFSRIQQVADSFRDHTTYLTELKERSFAGLNLVKSHVHVFSEFERFADLARFPDINLAEKFAAAQKAFIASDSLVRSAGEYFVTPLPFPRPFDPPRELRPSLHEAEDADRELEQSAGDAMDLVHTTARKAIVVSAELLPVLQSLVGDVVDERLRPLEPFLERGRQLSSPRSFLDTLHAFARDFQRDHWKALWAEEGDAFKQKPEEIAQAVLGMYLLGQFRGVAFVGRELRNGDGFVDVLVNFLGQDYVVEVKIVGASWSIGKATDGLHQLDEYVQNYDAPGAFLVVFDGRKSDRGEQLESEYRLDSGKLAHVIVVRSYFDAPSRKKR